MTPQPMTAAFQAAAAEDGVVLAAGSFDWLGEQGHLGLERVAKARRDPTLVRPVIAALAVLEVVFARLGGDVSVLRAGRETLLLPVDLVHRPTGTVIQLDDAAHFTSSRLLTLDLYPSDLAFGFDVDAHRALCRSLAPSADGLSRGLPARAFGFGGVQRERAYHDALRDLATPAMGLPPLVRVAAIDGDGEAAYRRFREGGGTPTIPATQP